MLKVSHYREISEDGVEEFFKKGYPKRYFFPHSIHYLPKCGPDALKLSHRMCGESNPNKQWEVLLYATSPVIDEFPEELFFDDDLIWHQQQLGKIGHIAFAYIVVSGGNLYGLNYVSDIVQRISRRREYKTRIEKKFKGWAYLLLNSIMNFAVENGIRNIYSPTADLAMEHTDPKRNVQRELFERVYDRAVNKHFHVKRKGKWWVIDVEKNRDRTIISEKKQEVIENRKTICLCHDIERGLGHIDVDSHFAEFANKNSLRNLEEMLIIEKEVDVKATYNVLGCFLNDVRERIEKAGHCLAFHSYDHKIANYWLYSLTRYKTFGFMHKSIKNRPGYRYGGQLNKCRQVDYRMKGYRPPQSKITAELSDDNLCFHNFEWLASSVYSLKVKQPVMQNGIVKIPIFFDDFHLYKNGMSYKEWEEKVISKIEENEFVAFCLHDCYAHYWLPYYKKFLEKIKGLGKLKTLHEVANEVILGSGK